jgi:predicted nucleic acid-binding Zn ribbon protein
VEALLQGLKELGWKRGGNLEIDLRWGNSDNGRIQTIAKELVAAQHEVLQVKRLGGAEIEDQLLRWATSRRLRARSLSPRKGPMPASWSFPAPSR